MTAFVQNVLTASFHGSIVILAVLLLRLLLQRTPKKFICYLWMLAGLRLLMPIPVQSGLSLQPRSIPITVNLSALVPAVWAAVAAVILGYSLWSYLHLRRQVADAVKVPGGWESDRIETAFVLGFAKPKIYIPAGMSGETRQQILAHERTHLDKGDHWIKMVGFLALALHWFNPLVWLSYVLLCKDIEMACDERVVQFMELKERKAYSAALLQCSTSHVHYAACPVAFGEVSVKYRIRSVLHYRKPGFWVSFLGLGAIAFVTLCLVTSPVEAMNAADPQAAFLESSQMQPEDFTPAVLPASEPNPDWGVTVYMDAADATGGRIIYAVEERFAAASENMEMQNATLERWNGESWESFPSQSGNAVLFERFGVGFAQNREAPLNYFSRDVDWSLYYGSLPAGDYRVVQTLLSDSDSGVFRTPFRIYREQLTSEQEAALSRCEAALDNLCQSDAYQVTFYESAPLGGLYPTKKITRSGSNARVDSYMGEYLVSSCSGKDVGYLIQDWDAPYRLNQNRKFLFPEGQWEISEKKISFCSVWVDWQGISHQGQDTYCFREDGSLESAERREQTQNPDGTTETFIRRLEGGLYSPISMEEYINSTDSYETEDSFAAMNNSPWSILFRVDDDLLTPTGGEVWLGTNAVGVSQCTTDGTYWLEKKVGSRWERLEGEKTASWGNETLPIHGKTDIWKVDWSADYGRLEAGVYRMGKYFYKGTDSIIQYAEFAIYQEGGIFGAGGAEAVARVDGALERLKSGNYHVEQYVSDYSPEGFTAPNRLYEVFWKYGDAEATEFYKQGQFRQAIVAYPSQTEYTFFQSWLYSHQEDSPYCAVYFPEGYSVISQEQITLARSLGANISGNPCNLFTYRFDENGNITEILQEDCLEGWEGYVTRYVILDTPDSEIQARVEQCLAEQGK